MSEYIFEVHYKRYNMEVHIRFTIRAETLEQAYEIVRATESMFVHDNPWFKGCASTVIHIVR